jgi:hypothetical protein
LHKKAADVPEAGISAALVYYLFRIPAESRYDNSSLIFIRTDERSALFLKD